MELDFRYFMEALGQFNYPVPKDKEKQLFDFYAISKMPWTGDVVIDYAIKETQQKLYPVLKKNLLGAVYFAIACEMRHASDVLDAPDVSMALVPDEGPNTDWGERYEQLNYLLGSALMKLFDTYSKRMSRSGRRYDEPKTRKTRSISRTNAYNVANSLGVPRTTVVKLAKALFEKLDWTPKFGGSAWAKICNGWLKLNAATSLDDMMVYIDHVYDLQHNSNVVLDKVQTYYKDGKITWLKNALDFKARIKSLYEIWDDITYDMRRLLSFANKRHGYEQSIRGKKVQSPDTYDRWKEVGEREYKQKTTGAYIRLGPKERENLIKRFHSRPNNLFVELLKKHNFFFDEHNPESVEVLRQIGIDPKDVDFPTMRTVIRIQLDNFVKENWEDLKVLFDTWPDHREYYQGRDFAEAIKNKYKLSEIFAELVASLVKDTIRKEDQGEPTSERRRRSRRSSRQHPFVARMYQQMADEYEDLGDDWGDEDDWED
jgi:hypothetical protein